jgi:hypothetical protein
MANVLDGPHGDLLFLGELNGFKYDENPTTDVSSAIVNNPPWVVTNGPADPSNSVSIFNVVVEDGEGKQFDWSATLGMDAVIVKAQTSNAYIYVPEAFEGAGLVAPDGRAVSHVEFCYDYELDVAKDGAGIFDRVYTWDINKDYDGTYDKFIGDPATTHGYEVSVDQTITDGNWVASGSITIENNTPFDASILSVDDVLEGGIIATVDCGVAFPYTLTAGDSLICSYTADTPDAATRVNTVTVTTEAPVGGGEATFTVEFTGNVVGFPSINVNDSNGESWTASGDDSWMYSRDFTCPTDTSLYVDGFYSFDHDNTATILETGQSDDATVTVNCYAPGVLKNVQLAPLTREYEWDIVKDFDETYVDFVGDPANPHEYSIIVTRLDQQVIIDARVEGSIFISNPNPNAAMSLTEVSDSVEGVNAQVNCPTLEVPGGGTIECTYDTGSPNDLDGTETVNTATVTFNGLQFIDTEEFVYVEETPINAEVNITDVAAGEADRHFGPTNGDTFNYTVDFQCPTDLSLYDANGFYTETRVNTATIDETGQSDDATVTLECYAPSIVKDAAASYDERHDWDVEKTVNPLSQKEFAGNPVGWTWTIDVFETVVDQNFAVTGNIDVSVPAGAPDSITVDVSDLLNDGTSAAVECGGGSSMVTVAPGATEICAYSAVPADATATQNTASFTFNGIQFSANAAVDFIKNVVNGSATLSDTEIGLTDVDVSGGDQFTGPGNDICSSDQAVYGDDGYYSVSISNTAILIDEEGTPYDSTATTTYTCYAPVLSKDADAGYDERHTWEITKSVDPLSQTGNPGDFLDWTWTVTVTESFVDENFGVSGSIFVTNPAGSPGAMTVSLADALDDGTVATVDCGAGATSIIVAAGTTGECTYTAEPGDASATLNTATGTFNSIEFAATADVVFETNVINGTATVDDDQEGDFPLVLNAGEGPWDWTETQDHTCSTDAADYGGDGTYSETLFNTATVEGSDGQTDEADAETTYTCEAGFMILLKLTDGLVDDTRDWTFVLFEGGYGGTEIGTSTTLADLDGVLEFGNPALSKDATYTVCELNVPAGWSTLWKIDTDDDGIADTTIIPYNPNAADDPPQDLGTRCFDFGSGTFYPVVVGQTLVFEVDNTFPGGNPRTPGYWKNWSSCTGGSQYAKTTDDVDPDNEFISLDEVLNDPGILWDDILADDFEFPINSCELAVLILDDRTNDGKKSANYGANTLAKHLLAYQLNQGAGACYPAGQDQYVLGATESGYPAGTPCPVGSGLEGFASCNTLAQHALDAETLLDEYDFDNETGILRPKGGDTADYWKALDLAFVLDLYNNGMYCGDMMP